MSTDRIHVARTGSPVGPIRVAQVVDGPVVACAFDEHFDRVSRAVRRRWARAGDARAGYEWADGPTPALEAVDAYLGGDLDAVDGVAVDLAGTEFQQRVWAALRRIPAGETRSYADVAADAGNPEAVRAVGTANGANPVWVVVPCHRVIRNDGALGGYGGGIERKRWLLAHELGPETSVTSGGADGSSQRAAP